MDDGWIVSLYNGIEYTWSEEYKEWEVGNCLFSLIERRAGLAERPADRTATRWHLAGNSIPLNHYQEAVDCRYWMCLKTAE